MTRRWQHEPLNERKMADMHLAYSAVQSEEDLVVIIVVASGDISEMPGLFHNIRQSLRQRYHKCIDVGGGNFGQFLKSKCINNCFSPNTLCIYIYIYVCS